MNTLAETASYLLYPCNGSLHLVFWIYAQAEIDAHNILEVDSLKSHHRHSSLYTFCIFNLVKDKVEEIL